MVLNSEYDLASDVIYLYHDRNDRVYKLQSENVENKEGGMVCMVENADGLSGEINADIVTGSKSLLERIFIKAGRG